jgi:N-acyl-phosphatidylethanolamine-hydrolysing phospholipase D
MSGVNTSAALYAAVTSPTALTGAAPEDAPELRHHVKNGKGFINPWDSFVELGSFKILRTILW